MAIVLPAHTTELKPIPWNASQGASAAPNLWRGLRLFVPIWDVGDPQDGHYGWFDIVGRRQPTGWTVTGTPNSLATIGGNGTRFDGAERVSITAYDDAFTIDTDFTFAISFIAQAAIIDDGSLWARADNHARGGNSQVDWGVMRVSGVWRGRWLNTSDVNYKTDTTTSLAEGDFVTAFLKRRGDTLYMDVSTNGLVTFDSTGVVLSGTGGSDKSFNIGSDDAVDPTLGTGVDVLSFGSWGRALTDAEIRQLAADPFVLIRPARHILQTTTAITGTLAVTEAADSLAASGTVTAPTFTGTLAVTEQADSLAASGTFTLPPISGTLAVTENADGLVAIGTFVPGPISGTLILTEQPDTLAASGSTAVSTGRRQDGGLIASRQGGTMTVSRQEGGPV